MRGLTHFFPPLRFRNQVSTFAVRETASLGIMGAPRVPPLNPSETIVLWEHYRLWALCSEHPRFPHYAERRSLSDSKCWNLIAKTQRWVKMGYRISATSRDWTFVIVHPRCPSLSVKMGVYWGVSLQWCRGWGRGVHKGPQLGPHDAENRHIASRAVERLNFVWIPSGPRARRAGCLFSLNLHMPLA